MITDDKHIKHKHLLTKFQQVGYYSLIGKAIPCSLLSKDLLSGLNDFALLGGQRCE